MKKKDGKRGRKNGDGGRRDRSPIAGSSARCLLELVFIVVFILERILSSKNTISKEYYVEKKISCVGSV